MARRTEHLRQDLAFSTSEFTGALGDSITVLPIVVALGALTPLSLAHVLLAFAVFQVVWGVYYGLPMSVEPMKALAGLTIAGSLTYGELIASGLLVGVVLVVAGRTGAVGWLAAFVGEPAVRGVQLGVALVLARAGIDLALGDPWLAALGLLVGVTATAFHRQAGAVAVLAVGTLIALGQTGLPVPTVPSLGLFPNGGPVLSESVLHATAAQLAMTVGNAAVATSLLCGDLFDAEVSPDRLAESTGTMSLLSVPFGGIPMCHGSGGLAGKYAFGARTGGANLLLGCIYLIVSLVTGLWGAFPLAMLGVLLLAVAAQLGSIAVGGLSSRRWLVALLGVLALATNVGVAFVVGIVADRVADRFSSSAL